MGSEGEGREVEKVRGEEGGERFRESYGERNARIIWPLGLYVLDCFRMASVSGPGRPWNLSIGDRVRQAQHFPTQEEYRSNRCKERSQLLDFRNVICRKNSMRL